MRTPHIALTLRGTHVASGIEVSNGQIPFSPDAGMTRHDVGILAATPAPDGALDIVHVALVDGVPVLIPCSDNRGQELVLVQQYHQAAGGKRWPSFHVDFGSEVRKLSEACTSRGSGGEHWVLVSAPLGWAANIASQFVNERDVGGQRISFKPGQTGSQESDLPKESDPSVAPVAVFTEASNRHFRCSCGAMERAGKGDYKEWQAGRKILTLICPGCGCIGSVPPK